MPKTSKAVREQVGSFPGKLELPRESPNPADPPILMFQISGEEVSKSGRSLMTITAVCGDYRPDVDGHREEIQHDIARSKVVWQLFSSSWFYRAWTFQEPVLSQSAVDPLRAS